MSGPRRPHGRPTGGPDLGGGGSGKAVTAELDAGAQSPFREDRAGACTTGLAGEARRLQNPQPGRR